MLYLQLFKVQLTLEQHVGWGHRPHQRSQKSEYNFLLPWNLTTKADCGLEALPKT